MKNATHRLVTAALAFAFVLRVALAASARQAAAVNETERVERPAALGRMWAAVKFFHPYLAYRDVDRDAAAVAAIRKVNAARDAREYAAAANVERHPVHKLNPDGVLVVTVSNYADLADFAGVGRQLQRAGLVPYVEVRPTVEGVRTGRDEVLERALEYPQKELR